MCVDTSWLKQFCPRGKQKDLSGEKRMGCRDEEAIVLEREARLERDWRLSTRLRTDHMTCTDTVRRVHQLPGYSHCSIGDYDTRNT